MICQIEHVNYGKVSPIEYQVNIRTLCGNKYGVHFFCAVFDEIGIRFEYAIIKNGEHIDGDGGFTSLKKAEKEAMQKIKDLENIIGEPLK